MRLSYKKKLVEILRICDDFNKLSKSRKWLKENLREAIASLSSFNVREKAALYDAAFQTAVNPVSVKSTVTVGGRSGVVIDYTEQENCKELVKLMGKLERHTDSKDKKTQIKKLLARSREADAIAAGRYPIIFYACSKHSNPANDHKDYQGKIYVDRYWRKYTDGTVPEWFEAAVEEYIRKNNIISIQKIMGPPVWLATRPFCRHRFYPLSSLSVLTENQKDMIPVTHGRPTKRGATYEYIKKHL